MNHPYMYPDQCPWTEDYWELQELRQQYIPRHEDDEDDEPFDPADIDCGTWGHLLFDTEEQAREYADSITDEYIAEEIWDEEGSAEPYWLEPEPGPAEIDSAVEQSLDYFNHYIAGDR